MSVAQCCMLYHVPLTAILTLGLFPLSSLSGNGGSKTRPHPRTKFWGVDGSIIIMEIKVHCHLLGYSYSVQHRRISCYFATRNLIWKNLKVQYFIFKNLLKTLIFVFLENATCVLKWVSPIQRQIKSDQGWNIHCISKLDRSTNGLNWYKLVIRVVAMDKVLLSTRLEWEILVIEHEIITEVQYQ